MTLKSMIYIRNNIHQGADLSGQRHGTVAVNTWRSGGSDKSVDFRVKPVKGEHEMVYLVPRSELKSGAYAVDASGTPTEYFFIDKKVVTNNISESDYCVDVLIPPGLGSFLAKTSGAGYKTIPCNKEGSVARTSPPSATKEKGSSESAGRTDRESSSKENSNRQESPAFKQTFSAPLEDYLGIHFAGT
jgi:hypothetical protein